MTQHGYLDARAMGARRFDERVCVIAGAGQGIGSATARRLGQEGASLVLGDWVQASAERVAAEIRATGAPVITHTGDYSLWEPCQDLMRNAHDRFGRIDVLVVVVGGTIFFQSFQLYSPEQIEAEINKSLWPAI